MFSRVRSFVTRSCFAILQSRASSSFFEVYQINHSEETGIIFQFTGGTKTCRVAAQPAESQPMIESGETGERPGSPGHLIPIYDAMNPMS